MKMAKEKTSRLGTGLSALFGEEENVLENETVQTLPISRVEPVSYTHLTLPTKRIV